MLSGVNDRSRHWGKLIALYRRGPEVDRLLWLASLTAVAALGVYHARHERTALRLRQAAAVFDHTREAIIITDARRRIVAVNPAFTGPGVWR